MQIRWDNIFGLILLVTGIYLVFKILPLLRTFLESLNDGQYGGGDPFYQFLGLGLLCVTVLGMVAIVFRRRR